MKQGIGFQISKVVGCVVGHVHKDHSGYVEQYEKIGIEVYKPYETGAVTKKFGSFTVQPFDLVHTTHNQETNEIEPCPCYGFYITHPTMGITLYITDTEYIKYRFKNVSHILCEANYDAEDIDRDISYYEHVISGHCSIQTAAEFIKTNDNPQLINIVLLHLSDKRANRSYFQETIKKVTSANVYVASKGLIVPLDREPF